METILSSFGPAANYVSKKPYRGINHLILNSLHHTNPYYLTFRQALGLGKKVKKGAKSVPVVFWKFIFLNKETVKNIIEEEARHLPP